MSRWGRNASHATNSGGYQSRGGGPGGPGGPQREKPLYDSQDFGSRLGAVTWNMAELSVFEKDFYDEHENVKARTNSEVDAFRKKQNIQIVGKMPPKPVTSFEEAGFPNYLSAEIKNAGFPAPTPIQMQAWPAALSGRDLVAVSATGSGKTLAFALPAMIHINAQATLKPFDGPIVLILAPTRELAVQIQDQCRKFGATSSIRNTCLYGGVSKMGQLEDLSRGSEIVVATPGRLLDFLDNGKTNLRRVTYLVLDEADRMLDQGFEHQLKKIIEQIRPDRQILMFSATWPREVQRLAAAYLKDPIRVTIGQFDLTANTDIEQTIEITNNMGDKKDRLVKHIERISDEQGKVLVFVQTKRTANDLTDFLRQDGWPALSIHGDKEQPERDWVLQEFKTGASPIMVATDVAARGIDVKDVSHVIIFDMAPDIESYVHRIGRTGRAGKKGKSIAFVSDREDQLAKKLIKILQDAEQSIPQELNELAGSGGDYGNEGEEGDGDYNGEGEYTSGFGAAPSGAPAWGASEPDVPPHMSNANSGETWGTTDAEPSSSQPFDEWGPPPAQSQSQSQPKPQAQAQDEWGSGPPAASKSEWGNAKSSSGYGGGPSRGNAEPVVDEWGSPPAGGQTSHAPAQDEWGSGGGGGRGGGW